VLLGASLKLIAVSAVTARRPAMTPFTRRMGTPIFSASETWVTPSRLEELLEQHLAGRCRAERTIPSSASIPSAFAQANPRRE
jgi:hypothetical protein